jgi:hypothetical protein
MADQSDPNLDGREKVVRFFLQLQRFRRPRVPVGRRACESNRACRNNGDLGHREQSVDKDQGRDKNDLEDYCIHRNILPLIG